MIDGRGDERLIRWTNVPLKDDKGQIIGVIASGEDITDKRRAEILLRESEEDYRDLFMNSPLPSQLMTKEGRLINVNSAWTEMTGYSAEEAIGKYMDIFLVPEDIIEFTSTFNMANLDNSDHAEYDMLKKNGERITISFNYKYKSNKHESEQVCHCIMKDITENRKMERELH
ncbi:PAS domain-containing protein [Methanolobus sp. ZRKC3]|uniref:PAS domain-containing protein n=1 Tax=Methanolobus sp. ZRKC3 TaxID=3125786 RepID=UPI003249D754